MTPAPRSLAAGRGIARRLAGAARRAAGFRRAEAGSSTVEFALMFPLFAVLLMSALESGMLMVRQVMLERALDIVVRDLRLGTWAAPTHLVVKQAICDEATVIPDCMNVVALELRPVSTVTWSPLTTTTTCVDRSEELEPVVEFTPGQSNELMIVRACAVFDPVFPTAGLGLELDKDATGAYALVATSAFVNEPS